MYLFYLTESLNSFWKAKVASFASIITIAVAVFTLAGSALLIFISDKIANHIKSRIEVDIFLEEGQDETSVYNLLDALEGEKEISRTIFTSKEEALKKMEAKLGKGFLSKVLEVNPLPASINIRFNPSYISESVINKVMDKYKNRAGVADIYFNDNFTLKVLSYIEPSNHFVYWLAGIFGVMGMLLVYLTSKIIINHKMYQFETMKLVGAKISSIKIPIILNGIITGFIAGIITIVIYYWLFFFFQKYYGSFSLFSLQGIFFIGLLILGTVFGFCGSYLSTFKIKNVIKIFEK